MTKRDTLTYIRLHLSDDGAGGTNVTDLEEVAIVPAHVSSNSTSNEITMYGINTQEILHTVTSKKLDDGIAARYAWSGKMFKVMRQVKSGNEWFATLLEVNE